jgi:OOP family OmpA-OmpF porin
MGTGKLIISGALAALWAVGSTAVLAHGTETDAYALDFNKTIIMSGSGHCVHTGSWTPAKAIYECDPDFAGRPSAVRRSGPPSPAFEKITLQTETLFDFDGASLRPEGKASLDDLVAKMKASPEVELIVLSGHTDRIGTEAYNMDLSQRRVDSVESYLMSQGVAADRIQSVAKGESEPVVDCKGERGRALVECLQPNRRVEIQIGIQKMKK